MSVATVLTPSLRSRLEAVARRARRLRVARGLSLVTLALVLTAAGTMLTDYFLQLPALLRLALFAGWVILGATTLCSGLVIPLCRRLDPADLAAAVEQKYPELAERLTTSVELADTTDEFHGSRALVPLLVSDTALRTSRLDFRSAVNGRGALALGVAAVGVFALALAPALVWTREYVHLGQRFFFAWNTMEWGAHKTAVPYDVEVPTHDIRTARGRPVLFRVHLVPHHDAAPLPTRSTLVLIDDNGQETRLPMTAERKDTFQLAHKITRDGQYRIEAGDAVSPTYDIQTIVPVELAVDSPAVTITAPPYARQTVVEQHLTGLLDLSALQHSDITFVFSFTRPAVAAFVEWTVTEIKETKTTSLPLALSEDRRSATLILPARVTSSYRLVLEAEYGIRTELDAKTLTVRVDQPPQVVKFGGKDELKAVLPYDRLPLEITAGDDIGVARADLEYRVNDAAMKTEPMTLTGANRPEVTAKHVFPLAGKVQEDDEISYRIRFQDNRPKEYGGPQTVYYPADRWLKLKVVKQAAPLREQEIVAQRDDLNKRLDTIRTDLLREQRGVYKVRQESRDNPSLAPEQAANLKQLQQDNRATENALRELAHEAEANPALERLAQQAEQLANREMRQSDAALQKAAEKNKEPAPRDNEFQTADKELASALQKLEELQKANDKLAQDRLDQQKVEMLADREKQLADRAAELAGKDPVRDLKAKEEIDKIKREQAEVGSELQRLSEQSEALRKALDEAHAEEAKKLSAKAQELAAAQRELTEAMKETKEPANKENPLGELAKQQARQQDLEKQANQLTQDLNKLGEEMNRSPVAAKSVEQASKAAQEAKNQMHQASEQQQQNQPRAARQTQQNAAQALEQAAKQASQASQQMASQQSANKPPQSDSQPGAEKAGQAVQQAQKQIGQAQSKLDQGQPQGAQTAMQQAAQSLQQAAQQLASQPPGQPKEMGRPHDSGAANGGRLDPSLFGPDAQKYAGKSWGELPGELQTKILQDMKAKYGDEYSRQIKLYFEQIADTKK